MSDEQSAPGAASDASIISRMTALDAGQPAPVRAQPPAAVPVAAEPPALTTEELPQEEVPPEEEAATDESEATGEDWIDFTDDDGEVIPVHKKISDRVHKWGEFVKEQSAVKALRAQAEDRLQYAEAREKFSTEIFADATELRAAQAELQKYSSVDWQAAYEQSPGQAMAAQHRMNELKQQVSEKTQMLQAKAGHIQRATAEHNANQWRLAEEGAIKRFGKPSEKDNIAMGKQVEALGFKPDEFKARFADPRIIHAIHKAAMYDQLKASAPSALNSVRKAPPVLKPGASQGPGVAAENKYRDQRNSLKKTGSVKDAAKLFLLQK